MTVSEPHVYKFDRFRHGKKMAEGATITRCLNPEDAAKEAARLFGNHPYESFVLREISARAEPSRGAPEAASKYWIVEWRFRSTQKDYDWQPISRSPFGSELAAKNYHQREGFEYRILEYAPKESAQEYRCNICGDHMKHGAQDETVIHFVPCECWRGNGGHVVLLEALRRIRDGAEGCDCDHDTPDCCVNVGYDKCAYCLADVAIQQAERT